MSTKAVTSSEVEAAGTRAELKHLRLVAAVLAAAGAVAVVLPLAVSAAERIAPWVAGEGVPIARLFGNEAGDEALPSFAEASAPQIEVASGVPAGARTTEQPSGAAEAPAGDEGSAGPAAGIAPSEYEGVVQPIEGVKHLAPFFKQLARTLRGETKAVTRIAHYGDSAVAADSITSTARQLLQQLK